MNESTKPVSIRLGTTLTKMLERIAGQEKKTVSDVVRENLERSVADTGNLRSEIAGNLSHPDVAINAIRRKLSGPQPTLTRSDYGTLMILWHQAYLHSPSQTFVDIRLFSTLMDMTGELFAHAAEQKIALDMEFLRSRMEVRDDSLSDQEAAEWVKSSFKKNRCAVAAEGCLRPMSIMSDYLSQFSTKSLKEAFTAERIQQLIPLAVWGARDLRNPKKAPDLGAGTLSAGPKALSIEVGAAKLFITSAPFGMVIDGEQHCYAFKPESLMSLAKLFEGENLSVLSTDEEPWAFFERPTLKIQRTRIPSATYILQEYGGYHLHLSPAEFEQLRLGMAPLCRPDGDPAWLDLLNVMRNELGDF